jgi:hypothetical protein
MMKLILRLIPVLFLLPAMAQAQIGMGEWRIHSDSKNARDVVHIDNVIYFAFDAGILEYDKEYKEYTSWDVINGLSDLHISKLGVHTATKSVFIGYENGNIDQIVNGQSYNIPGIKLANILGSKRINSFKQKGNFIYAATGFGVVKIDPLRREIKDTYYPTAGIESIVEITFKGDSIFALSPTKLFKAHINNPALADVNQWEIDSRVRVQTNPDLRYQDIEEWNGQLYIQQNFSDYAHDSLFVIANGTLQQARDFGVWGQINSIQVVDGLFAVNGKEYFIFIKPTTSIVSNDFELHFYKDNDAIDVRGFTYFDERLWFADAKFGAIRRDFDGTFERQPFKGPERDTYFRARWHKGVLAVVPGMERGLDEYIPPGIMFFENEKWTSIQPGLGKWNANRTWDMSVLTFNPSNPDQLAIAGRSKTPLSIIDKKTMTVVDTFGVANAPFSKQANGSVFISDLCYDKNNNLWVLNSGAQYPLKLYKDNQWTTMVVPQLLNKPTKKLYYDYNGTLWIATNSGLVAYKSGDDPVSTADDKKALLTTSEYAGALPSNNVLAIAMDFDNRLWVGTENGFGILYNPENVFDGAAGSFNLYRPKITINGETDYILGSTVITDIEVDGGNRKWIATANSGIILLSPDGLEVIQHFTMSNSPLISDNIIDLEINHTTGEVFVITDKGMMSYRSDASYEDATYSDVHVFPNPARPDFDGVITIQGIRFDSDVKITDVAGNLVYQTRSNGGTATWDGKKVNGEKVSSGVYLIWTASNINKGRFVGKVVVVN